MNSIRNFLMPGFAILAMSAMSSAADTDAAAQLKFFESKIRPLLVKRCFKCHADKKQKGGLRLDARSLMLKGGESGATIVPGKPDKSLLIEAVRYESLEMPPDGKLKPAEINLFVQWIADGAFWPEHDAEPRPAENGDSQFTDEDRQWWAFQPVAKPDVPPADGNGWARNEVDHFIWRKLAEQKMTPAPEADRRTLIRRLYFDLTGLPPLAADVDAFVSDESPDAYEQLVDRLLDSPRYGERQARHWLDLVRYSESDGYRKDDFRPTMWRYRDWVINSFNADKPFDRFVQEQIAGDEIDPDNPDAVVATAYWRLYLYEYNQRDVRTHWQAIIDELTDVSGEVFLGLGMGCAKCHDHKFDPILRDDYLRFQAFFSSILPRDDLPLGTREQKDGYATQQAAWEAATKGIRDQIAIIRQPHEQSKWRDAVEKFPPDIRVIAKQPESEWKALDRQLMDLVDRQVYFEYSRIAFKDEEKKKLAELAEQLKKFDKLKPAPLPVGFTVTDAASIPAKTITPGDSKQRDSPPGHLTLLNPAPADIIPPDAVPQSTGRRSALAAWLSDPNNPLATRVAVNRIWLQHFGTGIVATASDFGRLGELPSHPELLDWLTTAFLEGGWSTKTLHRMIVLSATYRQSAFHPDADALGQVDPLNLLRWRWDVRRLDAEQIRDAMLAASGELDLKTGGPSVDAKTPRRSIYTKIIRNSPDRVLKSFDATDGFNSTVQRQVTTTPTQSLLMINGAWPLDRAKAFAKRVDDLAADSGSPGSDPRRMAVQTAWQLAYGRSPTDREVDGAVGFLGGVASEQQVRPALTAPLAATDSAAANISATDASTQWKLGDAKSLPDGDFTIEAVIHLRSLYPNANVRTIVSHWSGNTAQRGWNFGVTSTKSAYQPRNLILQLVGSPPGQAGTGKPTYEVIASNLRPELNRPHYVAVSVKLAESSEAGITFYLQDLSQPDARLQTAAISHTVTGHFRPDLNLVLGDRDGRSSRWDGLLDNVRISAAALKADELLINSGAGRRVVGFWQFNQQDAAGQDASPAGNHLAIAGGPAGSRSGIPEHALADLCHVILNSNEFLYLD